MCLWRNPPRKTDKKKSARGSNNRASGEDGVTGESNDVSE